MWQTIRLGDVCTISSSKRIFAKEYQTEGIPFYRGKEVIEKHNGNKVSTELFISPKRYEEIKGKYEVPKKGDILLTSVGTLGIPWLVDEDDFYFKDGNLTWLRCNTQILPSYLYLWLNSAEAQNQIDVKCIGSTQKALTIETLNKFQITLPSLELQKKIVAVINPIESRININRSVNENLLEQATALFDNALQQSESISFVELSSLADVKGGKRLPKGVNLISKPNSHPYIRVRNLNNMIFASLSSDYEYVDDETQKSIARYITSAGDVLVSIVGTIGLTAIVDDTLDNANLTENCVKLTNLKGITPEYLLLFLRSKIGIESINKGTVGAVQLKLPIKNIQSIPVPLLMSVEMQALSDILSIMFNRISSNIIETKRLSELRDVLLPKLMSGELDVSDIDL